MVNNVGYSFSHQYQGNATNHKINQSFKRDISFGTGSKEIKGFKRALKSLNLSENKGNIIIDLGLEKEFVSMFGNSFLGKAKYRTQKLFGDRFADLAEEVIFGAHPLRTQHTFARIKNIEKFDKLIEEAKSKRPGYYQSQGDSFFSFEFQDFGPNDFGKTPPAQPPSKKQAALKTFKKYGRNLGNLDNLSPDEVKKAYRHLAKKYHPDRSSDGGAAFREINNANEILNPKIKIQ